MADKSDPTPTGVGRKTKLTRDLLDALVKAAEVGLTSDKATEILGISSRTVRRWRASGRKGEEGLVKELHERLSEAEERWTAHHLKLIADAAAGIAEVSTRVTVFPDGSTKTETTTRSTRDWRASAWLLAHAWPEAFGSDSLDLVELDKLVGQMSKQLEILAKKPPIDDLLGRLPPGIERTVRESIAQYVTQDHDSKLQEHAARIEDPQVREEFQRFLVSRKYQQAPRFHPHPTRRRSGEGWSGGRSTSSAFSLRNRTSNTPPPMSRRTRTARGRCSTIDCEFRFCGHGHDRRERPGEAVP